MSSLPEALVQFRTELEHAIDREHLRLRATRRRNRLIATFAAGLAVVIGTASAFGTVRELFSDTTRTTFGTPAWSPDGRHIAYLVGDSPADSVEVSIMNADGSGQRVLTRERWLTVSPVWSPDSRRIALLTNRCAQIPTARACATMIYVINADGSGKRKLARGGSTKRNRGGQPEPGGDGFAWSHDGRRIAFVSDRDGAFDLYVMNADGSGQRRLTHNRTTELGPVWSPDGQKIAFSTTTFADPKGPPRRPEIRVVNADGSGQSVLARGDSPSWSPDGRRIAFVHETPYLGREIHVMNADGTKQERLTQKAGYEDAPHWSPDGRQILFVRVELRSGHREINVIGADGTGQRTLIRETSPGSSAVWSPEGRKIAYVSNGDVHVITRDGRVTQNLSAGDR